MAKLQHTPLMLIEEVVQTTDRYGMVVMNLLSNGVVTSIALSTRSAMFLSHDLRRAVVDVIDQRGDGAEILSFKREA